KLFNMPTSLRHHDSPTRDRYPDPSGRFSRCTKAIISAGRSIDRDRITVDGAVEFGIVDQVLVQRSELLECRAPVLDETAGGVGGLPEPPTVDPVPLTIRPTMAGIARKNINRISCVVTRH